MERIKTKYISISDFHVINCQRGVGAVSETNAQSGTKSESTDKVTYDVLGRFVNRMQRFRSRSGGKTERLDRKQAIIVGGIAEKSYLPTDEFYAKPMITGTLSTS